LSYIGKTPTVGNFIKLDDISTSSTNSYTLQHNSVNFSPESANHMLVSLNGVIQAPNTSYSVSGSTITFLPSSGTLSSSDSIDFIMVYGNVLDVGVASSVADSSVTKGKLNLISDSSSAGLTVKGDGSSENGTIQLNCSQNSHGIKLSSPAHSSGQSYELIFPTGNVTADKVLKVASVSGSGTTGIGQLSFADAGGGRNTLLATQTISSGVSSFDMTDVMTDTYNNYLLVFQGMRVSVDGTDIRVTFFTGSGTGGHVAGGSDYRFAYSEIRTDGTMSDSYDSGTSFYRPNKSGIGNGSNETANGQLQFFDMRGTKKRLLYGEVHYTDANNNYVSNWSIGGSDFSDTACTGLRFEVASGNIVAGTFKLYGQE